MIRSHFGLKSSDLISIHQSAEPLIKWKHLAAIIAMKELVMDLMEGTS